jgi:hypothetical protein
MFKIPGKRLANIKTFDLLTTTSPISMSVGPDGCVYVAEFAGFWKAGAGANVSRYCWISDGETAAGKPAGTPTTSAGGNR